ncbi:LamG domain-containing protein [Flavobacterium sp.]|uniref:LamG domain-containing protein n=1 Tax=Flavobacterium sp. TaxID=239 RepID=UPI0031E0F812
MGSLLQNTIFGKHKTLDFSQNLVAYYKFDSNLNDTIAGKNGSNYNITYDSGIIGQAAVFNSASASVIEIPNHDVFNFSDGVNDIPFSISFWIYSTDNTTSQTLMYKANAGYNMQYVMQKLSGGQMTMALLSGNDGNLIRRAGGFTDLNTWVHFCFTYDGSKSANGLRWYKNGVLTQTEGTATGNYTGMPVTGENIFIGRVSWTWVFFLNAKLDEFYIWKNRELTPIEIAYAYNNGISGKILL